MSFPSALSQSEMLDLNRVADSISYDDIRYTKYPSTCNIV